MGCVSGPASVAKNEASSSSVVSVDSRKKVAIPSLKDKFKSLNTGSILSKLDYPEEEFKHTIDNAECVLLKRNRAMRTDSSQLKHPAIIISADEPRLFLPDKYNMLVIFDIVNDASLANILELTLCKERLKNRRKFLVLFAGSIKASMACWRLILKLIIRFENKVFLLKAEHELLTANEQLKKYFEEKTLKNLFLVAAFDVKSNTEFKSQYIFRAQDKTKFSFSSGIKETSILLHKTGGNLSPRLVKYNVSDEISKDKVLRFVCAFFVKILKGNDCLDGGDKGNVSSPSNDAGDVKYRCTKTTDFMLCSTCSMF